MPTIRPSILALALVLAFAACGGADEEAAPAAGEVDSAEIQRSAVRQIHSGMTREEVRNRLGEPRTRVTMDAGFERWTYYNYDEQGRIAAKTLIIFGNDGKVVEVNDL